MADRQDRAMTVADVAGRLAVSVRKVQHMAAARKLPGWKVGSEWRFDPAELAAWIAQQKAAMGGTCRRTYSVEVLHGMPASSLRASFNASAYERAISAKPRSGSKGSARKQSAKRSGRQIGNLERGGHCIRNRRPRFWQS